MRKIRHFAIFLLAVICISASGFHLFEELKFLEPDSFYRDMVSPWEEHMKLIREALPPGVYEISYLEKSNIPNSNAIYDSAEFWLTQYGMAPVVLVNGFGYEWMLGNFGNTVPLESIKPWLAEELGEYTIQDFGFGIYLIHDLKD